MQSLIEKADQVIQLTTSVQLLGTDQYNKIITSPDKYKRERGYTGAKFSAKFIPVKDSRRNLLFPHESLPVFLHSNRTMGERGQAAILCTCIFPRGIILDLWHHPAVAVTDEQKDLLLRHEIPTLSFPVYILEGCPGLTSWQPIHRIQMIRHISHPRQCHAHSENNHHNPYGYVIRLLSGRGCCDEDTLIE